MSRSPSSVLPSVLVEAAKELGYNETDYNGECQEGEQQLLIYISVNCTINNMVTLGRKIVITITIINLVLLVYDKSKWF